MTGAPRAEAEPPLGVTADVAADAADPAAEATDEAAEPAAPVALDAGLLDEPAGAEDEPAGAAELLPAGADDEPPAAEPEGAALVAAAPEVGPPETPPEAPPEAAPAVMQSVDEPFRMTMGDEYWTLPVPSRIESEMLVPGSRLTVQVIEVDCEASASVMMGAAETWPAGMTVLQCQCLVYSGGGKMWRWPVSGWVGTLA